MTTDFAGLAREQALRAALEEARETVTRLNRRCQLAEAAANLKVEEWSKRSKRAGRAYVFDLGRRYPDNEVGVQLAEARNRVAAAEATLEAVRAVAERQAARCRDLRRGASPSIVTIPGGPYSRVVGTCREDDIPRERWCLYCELAAALTPAEPSRIL